jgi:hypothetical protein
MACPRAALSYTRANLAFMPPYRLWALIGNGSVLLLVHLVDSELLPCMCFCLICSSLIGPPGTSVQQKPAEAVVKPLQLLLLFTMLNDTKIFAMLNIPTCRSK